MLCADPTYNPLVKMDSARYSHFYAISPKDAGAHSTPQRRYILYVCHAWDTIQYSRTLLVLTPRDCNLPTCAGSRWFDRIIKVQRSHPLHGRGHIVAEWGAPHLYLTEADFIPAKPELGSERDDDGWLLTIAWNASSDTSSVLLLDAATLSLRDAYPLPAGVVVPFHAHGVSCIHGRCFTNP